MVIIIITIRRFTVCGMDIGNATKNSINASSILKVSHLQCGGKAYLECSGSQVDRLDT